MSDHPADDVLLSLNRASTTAKLLSGTAHEVNNALQVISGTVEMLGMRADLPDDLKGALERIGRQSSRAAQTLADVQRYTRGDLELKSLVNVREAIQHVIGLRTFAMRRAGVAAEMDGDGSTPLFIHGNRPRFQQALFNVIINAEQALAGKGGRLRVVLEGSDGTVVVRVIDEGPGITWQPRERVFERFASSKPPADGAGLGLWAARQIVEAHGGTLRLADGAGATLVIELPRAKPS